MSMSFWSKIFSTRASKSKTQKKTKTFFRPQIDLLESRVTPAATLDLVGSVLTLTNDNSADEAFTISTAGQVVTFGGTGNITITTAVKGSTGDGTTSVTVDLSNTAYSGANLTGISLFGSKDKITSMTVGAVNLSTVAGTTNISLSLSDAAQNQEDDVNINSAVTLKGAGMLTVAVGANAGSEVTIAATGDITAGGNGVIITGGGGIFSAGDITTTNGLIQFASKLSLTGDVVLNAGTNGILFNSTVDGGFNLTANSTGTTTFSDFVGSNADLTSLTTNAGGTTQINGVAVLTTGTQTYGDAVTLGADTTLTGTTVTNSSTVAGGGNALTIDGNAVVGGAITGVTNYSVSGTTNLNANVTTTGTQIYTKAVTLGADTTLTGSTVINSSTVDGGGKALTIIGNAAVVGAITGVTNYSVSGKTDLNNNVTTTGTQTYGDAVTLSVGDTTLTGTTVTNSSTVAGGGKALTITGNAVVGGAITGVTNYSVSGTTALNGGAVTTTADQTYNDAVTLGKDTTLDGANLTFGKTVDGAFTLAATSAGTTKFGGAVTVTSVTTDAAGTTQINGGAVTTTADQTYNDAVTLGKDTTLDGANLTFGKTVDGAFTLAATSAGTTKFGGAVTVTSVTTDAAGTTQINGGAVLTTADQTYNDAVTLGKDTTLDGANLTFGKTVDGAFTLAATSAGTTKFGGAVTVTSVTTDAAGTTQINGGAVLTTADQTYNDAVTLGKDTTLDGANLTFGKTVDGAFTLAATSAGTTKFGGAVTVTSVTTDAAGTTQINGGAVLTTADQTYNDAVTLGKDTTLDGANLTFGKTVDGAFTLAATSAGTTKFGGAVTVTSVTTDAAGTTQINGGAVLTTADQTYNDAVTLGKDTTLDGANLTFGKTVDGAFTLAATSAGTTKFGGAVTVTSVTTDAAGTTQINGGAVLTTADQTYNDAVTLGKDTTLDGANLTFGKTVDGAFTLAATSAGTTKFGGAVTVTSVTTDAAGTTQINGGAVLTTADQTYNDAVTLGKDTTLDGANLTFGKTVDGAFTLAATSAGTTKFGGAVTVTSVTTDAAGTTQINGGAVLTTADQTYNDAVTLGKDTTLDGANLTFGKTVDGAFTLAATSAGTTKFGGAVTVTSVTTDAAGTTQINGGAVLTTADQTYNDAVTLGKDTTLDGANLTFGKTVDGAFTLAATSAGTTKFGGAVTVTSVTTDAAGTTQINGGAVLTTADQTYNDAVTLGKDTTLDGANLTFGKTVDGAFTLAATSAGTTKFGGAVTVTSVTTDAAGTTQINGGAVLTTADQTYNDAVTLGKDTTLDGANLTFGKTVDGAFTLAATSAGTTKFGGAVTVTSVTTDAAGTTQINGGAVLTTADQTYNDAVTLGKDTTLDGANLTFGKTVDGAFTLAATSAGTTKFGGAVTVTSVTTDAAGTTQINGGAVLTTADQTYNDAVTLGKDTTLDGANLTFGKTVDGAFTLAATSAGTTKFGGAVTVTSVTTDAAGTTQINGGAVLTTADQTYNDAVTLGKDTTLDGANLTFGKTVDGAFTLAATSAGTTKFGGAVTVTSVTTDAAGTTQINGGAVTTTADQTYNDAVTLGKDTTLDGANLTFGKTVDGAFTLAATSAGTTKFGGAVTVTSVTTDAAGTTQINGGAVTTTADQTYNDAVTLGKDTTLDGANLTFGKTVDGAFTLAATSAGTTKFGGAVTVTSVTTDAAGTTQINGGAVLTTGVQTYGDDVTLGATALLTSTGKGDISFNGKLDGDATPADRQLQVDTEGVTKFGGAVGSAFPLLSILTDAPGSTNIAGGSIKTFSIQTYNDPVTLGADAKVTSTNGGLEFKSSIDGGFKLTTSSLEETNVALNVGGSSPLTDLIIATSNGANFEGSVNTSNSVQIQDTNATKTVTFEGALTTSTLTVVGTMNAYNVVLNGTGSTITTAVNFNNTGTVTLGNDKTDELLFKGGFTSTAPANTLLSGFTRSNAGIMKIKNLDVKSDSTLDTTNKAASPAGAAVNLTSTVLLNGFDLNVISGPGNGLTLSGMVNVNNGELIVLQGNLNLGDGTNATTITVAQDTLFQAQAGAINVNANTDIDGGSKKLIFQSDNINLNSGPGSIVTTNTVTLSPNTVNIPIFMGDAAQQNKAGSINLTEGQLATINDKASGVIVGSSNYSGTLTLGVLSLANRLTILNRGGGGKVLLTGRFHSTEGDDGVALEIFGSGATTVLSMDITTNKAAVIIDDAVQVDKLTALIDTTDGSNSPVGANVLITGGFRGIFATSGATNSLTVTAGTAGNVTLGSLAGFSNNGTLASLLTDLTVTGNSISLPNESNSLAGSVTLNGSGAITINDLDQVISALVTSASTISVDDISASDDVTLTALSDIVVDDISASDAVSLMAGNNIVVDDISASGAVTLTAVNNIVVDDISASGAVSLMAGNNIVVDDISASGKVSLTAGTEIVVDDISALGDVTLTALNDEISVDDISAIGDVSLTAGNDEISVDDISATGAVTLTAGDNIEADDLSAGTGDLTLQASFISLQGNLSSTLGQVVLSNGLLNATTINLDDDISIQGVGVTLTGTVTGGNRSLTLDGGDTGAVAVTGAISGVNQLTLANSNGATFAAITAQNVQVVDTFDGQTVSFAGTLTASNGLSAAASGYNVALTGGASLGGPVSLLNTGSVTLGNGDTDSTNILGNLTRLVGTLNMQGVVVVGGNVLADDYSVTGGAPGSLSLTAANLNIGDLLSDATTVTYSAAGTAVLGSIGSGQSVTTVALDGAPAGIWTLASVKAGSLTTTAENYSLAINGSGAITNAVTFLNTGGVSLGNEATDTLTFNGGVTSSASVTTLNGSVVTSNDVITLGSDTKGVILAGNTTLNSAGGAIALGSAGVNAGNFSLSLDGGATGDVAFSGPVSNFNTLDVLNSNGVTFAGNVSGKTLSITDSTAGSKISFVGGLGTVYLDSLATSGKGYSLSFSTATVFVVNPITFLNTGGVQIGDQSTDVFNALNGVTVGSGVFALGSNVFLSGFGALNGNVSVVAGGFVAPGNSPGILSFGGNLGFNGSGSTFNAEINGFTAGANYDQAVVLGTVTLANATLTTFSTASLNPAIGQVITLIANDGTDPVSGTFNGLPEKTKVMVGGKTFVLSYQGGDGNDVVLSFVLAQGVIASSGLGTAPDGVVSSTVTITTFGSPTTIVVTPFPYFTGDLHVATADFTGDGFEDVIVGAGAGAGPAVALFDGKTGAALGAFFAYDPEYHGGVFVGAGDLDGNGTLEIITGAGAGGGPHVQVFNTAGVSQGGFYAYDVSFRGGVTVAAGDFDGDGADEIVTGPGAGGGPNVRVFSGPGFGYSMRSSFFAYAPSFTGGVFVSAGDVLGSNLDEIITGAGAGGGPQVTVFDGRNFAPLASTFAYGLAFTGGVRVGATDFTGDGNQDIITGAGVGGAPHVKVFDGVDTLVDEFFSGDINNLAGIFVS